MSQVVGVLDRHLDPPPGITYSQLYLPKFLLPIGEKMHPSSDLPFLYVDRDIANLDYGVVQPVAISCLDARTVPRSV